MLITVTLVVAALALALLAVTMGFVLGWANRTFHVHVDPKVAAVDGVLPGANCGGCGYVGCSEYAEAVARGDAELTLCAPGGTSCALAIGEVLGIEVGAALPYRAVVHCSAHTEQRLQRHAYDGEQTCESANLVAGVQGCTYGCLGLGDCVLACDYDAIHIIDGLATVDYEKCIGCKACARVCPRNIITMVPFKRDRMFVVACSNLDFGNEVKAVCQTGCIGCKGCSRVSNLMVMDGNRPTIDYDTYEQFEDFQPILDKCPMGSLVFVGKPTPEDVAAVADEEVPERVMADFKTTVDDTEWRG